MLNTLYITELRKELKYKRNSSVYTWCSKNGVQTFRDNGSNRYYVITSEFEKVRYSKFIKKLQKEYPKTWKEVLIAHQNNDIISISELEGITNSKKSNTKYKPTGGMEMKLWEEWNRSNAA